MNTSSRIPFRASPFLPNTCARTPAGMSGSPARLPRISRRSNSISSRKRQIAATAPMSDCVDYEISPGKDVQSEDELLEYCRSNGLSLLHPVGTCKMGVGEDAVVDPRLKVHGIKGLRVADASIMPRIVTGNTNAASIMIGEKAAALILEDAKEYA